MTRPFTTTHKIVWGAVLCSVLLVVPLAAYAETVLRAGESVSVSADQRVEEDFYGIGGSVTISGEIVGDMYAVGGSVTTNGSVAEDLGAVGGSVQVHAPVGDDVRAIGGEITIAEPVEGDVFVIGGSLTILSTATIGGDVFFYGGEAKINGAVGGSIMGTAERFRVDAPVAGSIDVRSSRALVLGERASVAGDVRYAAPGELTRATSAVIEGEVIQTELEQKSSESDLGSALTVFFIHVFALLCLYLLVRTKLTDFVHETLAHPSRSAVIGLAIVFAGPAVAILLMITILGLLLGLAGLFLMLALIFIAYVLSAAVVGALLARFTVNRAEVSFLWILAGATLLHIALLIPYLGALVVFAATVVTLGALVYRLYRMVR